MGKTLNVLAEFHCAIDSARKYRIDKTLALHKIHKNYMNSIRARGYYSAKMCA